MSENKNLSSIDPVKKMKDLLVLRLLFSLISLVVVGIGVMAILTEHYYGVSTRHGYKEITLDGTKAIQMGLTIVLLGLLPMGVWWSTRKQVLVWCVACVALFLFSLFHMIANANS
jgi:hypothetical protein